MRFPDAYKGIKKVFTAEILSIISAAIGVISFIFLVAAYVAKNDSVTMISIIGIIVFLVMTLIAFVLQLVGLHQAGNDERHFGTACALIIFSLVLVAAGSIITGITGNQLVSTITSGCSSLFTLLSTIYTIQGIMVLADTLGDDKTANLGKNILTMIVIIYVLYLVAYIISLIFHGNLESVIYNITTTVSSILQIVQYITFLVLLGKAKKMLAQ